MWWSCMLWGAGDDRELLPKLYSKPRDHIWKRQFTFQ